MINQIQEKIGELAEKATEIDLNLTVPDKIAESRMSICNSCEHLYKPASTCRKCGCFMTLKTKLKFASCPINKWDSYKA